MPGTDSRCHGRTDSAKDVHAALRTLATSPAQVDSLGRRTERGAGFVVFAFHPARAQADLESPLGQQVHRRQLLGEKTRGCGIRPPASGSPIRSLDVTSATTVMAMSGARGRKKWSGKVATAGIRPTPRIGRGEPDPAESGPQTVRRRRTGKAGLQLHGRLACHMLVLTSVVPGGIVAIVSSLVSTVPQRRHDR